MSNLSLLEVIALRNGTAYRAAEALRRRKLSGGKGAKKVSLKENSPEYAALRLLIGTWEAIGQQVLSLGESERVPFFQANPIGHVWAILRPWVMQLRKDLGEQYARSFEAAAYAYDAWLRTQPKEYQTAAQNGITALFG